MKVENGGIVSASLPPLEAVENYRADAERHKKQSEQRAIPTRPAQDARDQEGQRENPTGLPAHFKPILRLPCVGTNHCAVRADAIL